jgi:CHAT domain-containing protein/tetratricopeptide (TPR) repeat protein
MYFSREPLPVRLGWTLLLVLLFRAEAGTAQTTSRDSAAHFESLATAAYQQGTTQDLQHSIEFWGKAARAYTRVGERASHAFVLGNIGLAYQRLGQPDSALVYFRTALAINREVNDSAAQAWLLNNIGNILAGLGLPDSALVSLTAALRIQRELGERAGEAATTNSIGLLFAGQGRTDSALVYFNGALSIQRELGDDTGEAAILGNIGSVFGQRGLPDSALTYLNAALPIQHDAGDRDGEAATLNSIGLTLTKLGRLDSALAYLQAALPIFREVSDRPKEATTLNNLGLVFAKLSRPDSALAYYLAGLTILREVGARGLAAGPLTNIGVAFAEVGRPDSALAYYNAALSIAREVKDRAAEAATMNSIGSLFNENSLPDSALAYYRATLSISREIDDRHREAEAVSNIGAAFAGLSRRDSALTYLRAALPIQRQIGDRGGEAKTLNNIGAVFALLNRPDSALAYYQSGLAITRQVGASDIEVKALSNLGLLYHDSRGPGDAFRAVAYLDSAAALSANIRKHAGGEANQIAFAEQHLGLFELWPLAWLALGSEEHTVRGTAAALGAAERGRAQSLLDLMRRTADQANGVSGISSDLNRPGTDLAAEADSLLASLRRSHTAALIYLPTLDTLITWILLPSGDLRVVRSSIGSDSLAVLLTGLRAGPLVYEGSASALASLLMPPDLLAPIPAGSELVIIPQGMLALVPFAALPSGANDEPLGIRYALRYAPSLAALNAAEGRRALGTGRTAQLRNALVVGNPTMPLVSTLGGTERLRSLPGAELEGRRTAAQLGVTPLTGSAASERVVRQRLPGATIIHLATHGLAYSTEARVRNSYIALAPDSLNDGLLTVGEILDDPTLTLQADLVVLSACQTGLGDLKYAEGTVGLQRAFLARGARSVLVSLWNVDDRATALLMERFYTHWLSDDPSISKAEALRLAQDSVRKTPGFEQPSYWAAFQLVGAR